MVINFNDPLSGLSQCTTDRERRKLFDICAANLGIRGAVHSYISYDLHKLLDGTFKPLSEVTKDYFGLVPFDTVRSVFRTSYPHIYKEIKKAGGHLYG